MDVKEWNGELKRLKQIIYKEDKFDETKELILRLHSMVHSNNVSKLKTKSFFDILWDDLNEDVARNNVSEKGRTVLYNIYHSSRIEDITFSILVNNDDQVFNKSWKEKINTSIIDTGNSLNEAQILELSKDINIDELKKYKDEVGKKTTKIFNNLRFEDLKRKFSKEQLQRIFDEGAVLGIEECSWLVDYWSKKDVAGIILMPGTRHNLVHINQSMRAKKKKYKPNK